MNALSCPMTAGNWFARENKAQWELYNLNEDRSEQLNVSAQHPDKMAEMIKEYEVWVKRCMVEPCPEQKK